MRGMQFAARKISHVEHEKIHQRNRIKQHRQATSTGTDTIQILLPTCNRYIAAAKRYSVAPHRRRDSINSIPVLLRRIVEKDIA